MPGARREVMMVEGTGRGEEKAESTGEEGMRRREGMGGEEVIGGRRCSGEKESQSSHRGGRKERNGEEDVS